MSTYYYPTIDPKIVTVEPVVVNVDPINPQYYNLYGYSLLSQIYKNLIDTLTKYPDIYNLKLKEEKNKDILEKLEKLKQLEKEIIEELENAKLKQYLQISSKGYIDPDRIPDKDLPAVLEKHSNLLNLTTKYNTNVLNLVNILRTMNNVLTEKLKHPKYKLSMSINYPIQTISYIP